jgi:hypothetical protein
MENIAGDLQFTAAPGAKITVNGYGQPRIRGEGPRAVAHACGHSGCMKHAHYGTRDYDAGTEAWHCLVHAPSLPMDKWICDDVNEMVV